MFDTLEPAAVFNSNAYGLSDFEQSSTQTGLIDPFQQSYYHSSGSSYYLTDSFSESSENNEPWSGGNSESENSTDLANYNYQLEETGGWEYNYRNHHSSENEIVPGFVVQTESSVEFRAAAEAYFRGEFNASISDDTLNANLSAETGVQAVVSASGNYNASVGIPIVDLSLGSNTEGEAEAFAGSRAAGTVDTTLGLDGAYLGLGGEAFAGSSASVNGSQALVFNGQELAEVNASAGVQAGIGVSANYDIGFRDGEFNFNIGASLALGIGIEFEFGGSVNLGAITDSVSDVWDAGTDLISDTWEGGTEFIDDAFDFGYEFADNAIDVGTEVVSDVVDTGVEIVSDVVDAGVGAVSDAGEAVVETVGKALPWNW
jgi:hypothetical protein